MQADVYGRALSFPETEMNPEQSTGDRGRPNKPVDNRI